MRSSFATFASPIDGEAAERPLLAVWLALALSLIVPLLPLFPVVGYLVHALAATERGDGFPAFFQDTRGLLRRSFAGSLCCLLFLGLPLVALLVTVNGIVTMDAGAGDVPTVQFLAGSTATLLAALLGFYLLPIALTTYGREQSLRRALSLGSFRDVGGHGAYFFGWTIGCAALTLAAGLAGGLFSVPQLGPLLGTLVLAYGILVTVGIWGRSIARARRRQ